MFQGNTSTRRSHTRASMSNSPPRNRDPHPRTTTKYEAARNEVLNIGRSYLGNSLQFRARRGELFHRLWAYRRVDSTRFRCSEYQLD
jgi:hypothetical protein